MEATLKDVSAFFEFPSLGAFRAEWSKLSDEDKRELREGIGNGSLTY